MIRALLTTAAVAAAIPTAASAKKEPAVAGSLEFAMAPFFGSYTADPDAAGAPKSEEDLTTAFAVIPAIDKMIGRNVAFGAEMMFVWAKPDVKGLEDEDRQLILNPQLRARMSFPIVKKVKFDAMIGLGISIWTGQDAPDLVAADGTAKENPISSTRFGWSTRFNFGGSYELNDSVDAFANIGYYTTTSYGDDIKANINMVPIGVGLRSAF